MIFADCQKDLLLNFWSRDLAWRMAEMSAQAYRDCRLTVDDIRRRWDAHGTHRITRGSQSVLVIWDSDDVVIAFEGSNATRSDWLANVNTDVEFFAGQMVHAGFLGEFRKVKADLQSLLGSPKVQASVKRRHLTGHSQGGSVAEIAGLSVRPMNIYTFGTPKSFDEPGEGSEAYAHWWHWRSNDGVPHLPISGDLHHRGKLCYVRQKPGGGGIPEPSFWQLAFLKLRSYRLFDTLNDHDIQGYVESLAP